MKERTVAAIKRGTVIDHIPSDSVFKVSEILKLDKLDNTVVIASNLTSTKNGKKGLIKVEDMFLDEVCLQKIAIIARDATISRIEDYKVTEKTKLKRPKVLKGILKCFNPGCITNHEPMETEFYLESEKPLIVRCKHCEREMQKRDVELK